MRSSVMALFAGVTASLCCTGPILLTTIGATTLVGFTWLEPLRPYLSLAAVGLIGWAFWRSYRPSRKEACCSPEDQARLKRQRRTLWLTSIVVALFLAFPFIYSSAVAADGKDAHMVNDSQDRISTWTIDGMTCNGCAAGLEASLAAQPGMLACEVRFQEGRMDCRVDGKQLRDSDIPGLVDQLGYHARLAEPDEKRAS